MNRPPYSYQTIGLNLTNTVSHDARKLLWVKGRQLSLDIFFFRSCKERCLLLEESWAGKTSWELLLCQTHEGSNPLTRLPVGEGDGVHPGGALSLRHLPEACLAPRAYSGRGEPTTYTSCRGGERHVVLPATTPLSGLRRASHAHRNNQKNKGASFRPLLAFAHVHGGERLVLGGERSGRLLRKG